MQLKGAYSFDRSCVDFGSRFSEEHCILFSDFKTTGAEANREA